MTVGSFKQHRSGAWLRLFASGWSTQHRGLSSSLSCCRSRLSAEVRTALAQTQMTVSRRSGTGSADLESVLGETQPTIPLAALSLDRPTYLPVRERSRSIGGDVVRDESGLDVLRVLARGRLPSHEQVHTVAQLPDVATAPMSNRFSPAMAAVLVQPLPQPSTSTHSPAGLADIENRGSIDPRTFELIGRHRRISALDVPGAAGHRESRLVSGWSEDDVDTSNLRNAIRAQLGEPLEPLKAGHLQAVASTCAVSSTARSTAAAPLPPESKNGQLRLTGVTWAPATAAPPLCKLKGHGFESGWLQCGGRALVPNAIDRSRASPTTNRVRRSASSARQT